MCLSVSKFLRVSRAPQKRPQSLPFIVEGGTGVIHALVTWRRVNGGGLSEPYSLLLWRKWSMEWFRP